AHASRVLFHKSWERTLLACSFIAANPGSARFQRAPSSRQILGAHASSVLFTAAKPGRARFQRALSHGPNVWMYRKGS
ncbi:MAG: hypothetical protein ACREDR_21405, partial [Blastocatellia bacterium]